MLNGLVYKLKCNDPNIIDFYIGSSVDMKKRIGGHKSSCKNPNSKEYNKKVYKFIRNNGGWDNWLFETLLEVQVESKKELRKKYERKFQLDLLPKLNVRVEGRTIKQYYIDNKEERTKYFKEHYEDNKEERIKKSKEYNEKHKEEILKKANQKIKCECGGKYTHQNKSIHNKSKKHKYYIEELLKTQKSKGV